MKNNRIILLNAWLHKRISRKLCSFNVLILSSIVSLNVLSQEVINPGSSFITNFKTLENFTLSSAGKSRPIYLSDKEFPGVTRVTGHLQNDILAVTGAKPGIFTNEKKPKGEIVIIGTLGFNPLIDKLAKQGKIDAAGIEGKWESFIIQVIDKPFPGTDRALVIAGSDKRGTIYGIYELSSQIGVSPWYWWADVPVKKQTELFVLPGSYTQGEPAVKYRGIFLNDEAPALSGWTKEKFGGFNHLFYENVFELILRLKGNYLWPAMWGNAFNIDDTLNPVLADEYGIVMGTSHHEPMMRAQQEWKLFGTGEWNYENNKDVLQKFWKDGIINNDSRESIVTIGMRGDGDMPMTEESNISLLERIVKDQREIIGKVTGKDPSQTHQMWALYKEVQEYYDKGMRVPDDITLLFCDDNWGNIRRLPALGSAPRKGGYGIYYHFDYVGGPRNYKWLNTNQIERTWEQMNTAYQYGANRVWIVNVGDLKPMEFPIQFFLDFAWNPENYPADKLKEFSEIWTEKQFGKQFSSEIAEIMGKYTMYNSRRKPELLNADVYSLLNYREAETIVKEYQDLANKATRIYNDISGEYKNAYYQLVLFPVLACSNLYDLYYSVALNQLYASQGRASTNDMAEKAEKLFERDSLLSAYYNDTLSNGKWSHMMDQTHIGYTYWQQPPKNAMPVVSRIEIQDTAEMGVSVEGSSKYWPADTLEALLPMMELHGRQECYIEIFNRGNKAFNFSTIKDAGWLNISSESGLIEKDTRLIITANWDMVPEGKHMVPIQINEAGDSSVTVFARVNKLSKKESDLQKGFIESSGYVSMEAEHYSRAVDNDSVKWITVSGLGRTLSGVIISPSTSERLIPGKGSPRLEYDFSLQDGGKLDIIAFLSPGLDFTGTMGLQFGISLDDGPVEIINLHSDNSLKYWETSVADNIVRFHSSQTASGPGLHTLKYWMVDPGVVLQKLVIDAGGLKPSYLGPPESKNLNK